MVDEDQDPSPTSVGAFCAGDRSDLDYCNPAYLRSLARLRKVTTKKLGHDVLYLKADVDSYIVEDRGKKVARAQKARFNKPDGELKKAS